MIANIFYLAKPIYGGWPTFTAHLINSFHACGILTRFYKVGKKFETKLRMATGAVEYQNIASETIGEFAKVVGKQGPIIVVAVDKHYAQAAKDILSNGGVLVVHDPTEIPIVTELLGPNVQSVVIRRQVQSQVEGSVFIRHPYLHTSIPKYPRKERACSLSRLDWDKHTEIIAAANKILPLKKRVDIWGNENRLYTFTKLTNGGYPTWKSYYRGAFPRGFKAPIVLASQYETVVDMSVIAGDGGGTQYTFLEAWAAGCQLIINNKWLGDVDDMQPNHNCIGVDGGEDLARHLLQPVDCNVVEGGRESLKNHSPNQVIPEWVKLFS